MIGRLIGLIEEISDNYLLINVNNVCYIVYVSTRDLNRYSLNSKVSIETYNQVREDSVCLFGFYNVIDKQSFLYLLKVSGVSSKIALAILGKFSSIDLMTIISGNNKHALLSVCGVGNKLAERIMVELKDIFVNKSLNESSNQIIGDAVNGLLNLGYQYNSAYNAVLKACAEGECLKLDVLIKQSLCILSQKN